MLFEIFLILVIILIFFISFYKFIFLRDPERNIPNEKNIIVSPADGKVISILKIENKEEIKIDKKIFGKIKTYCRDVGKECYIISIFMNPLNVHINRSPVPGEVIKIKYEKGKFFSANSLKAFENEKNEILIKSDIGNIKVIQIAGLIARRIRCYIKENQKIKIGEKIGLIDLASQVSLILPNNVKIKVKEKEKVKAGESVIAYY
jgi:phosphatidylserine decarboxylase